MILVRWTGDADVDILVEEPTGTICSLRNFRTTSGGVLSGDVSASDSLAGANGHCQMYLCPKGFDGTYKLLVRRVWGQVITGKVSVELIAHYGTPEVKRMHRQIALEKAQPPSRSCSATAAAARRSTPSRLPWPTPPSARSP